MSMEPLSPITMIAREMERKHINVSELGRGLKIKHSSVVGMMQRSTLQVQRLAEASEFLNYNFFREIANKLPYTEPDYTSDANRAEVNGLQNRIKDLELEVSILRQTIKDLAGR